MNLWAVTMVRDELDILPYTLSHLASEGVNGIIVADNRSVDGTREWLMEAQDGFGCELEVLSDDTIGYYQSAKMTALAERAFAHGAEWVLPFDADELWFNADQAQTVHQTLSASSADMDAGLATVYNYFPMSQDSDEPNPFLRITHRDVEPAPLAKVVVHRSGLRICQGNHDVEASAPLVRQRVPLRVGHFPWRSQEQFVRKARNGSEAYKATDLPLHMGAHWRQYGEILETTGEEALHQVFHEWFQDPPCPIVHDPVPWRRHANAVGKDELNPG